MFSLLEKSYLGCWVEVVETLFFPRRLMLNSDESSASGKTEKRKNPICCRVGSKTSQFIM